MRLEAAKFRPREVVKHVLQTSAASLQKSLTLEGNIADDVPIEVKRLCTSCSCLISCKSRRFVTILRFQVIGDVLRIRQILTNLLRYFEI